MLTTVLLFDAIQYNFYEAASILVSEMLIQTYGHFGVMQLHHVILFE